MPVVDALRRRPPGRRLLVYLDQSARSRLVEGKHPGLLEVLRSEAIISPHSMAHEHETECVPDPTRYQQLRNLANELSLGGIRFRDESEIRTEEMHVAVMAFLGLESTRPLWREAMTADPHTPLEERYPHGVRIMINRSQTSAGKREAEGPKSLAPDFQSLNEEVRTRAQTFEQRFEIEFSALFGFELLPFANPEGYRAEMGAAEARFASDVQARLDPGRHGSGWAAQRYWRDIGLMAEGVLTRFPGFLKLGPQFVRSDAIRSMPSFALPALLMAAFQTAGARKARPSDIYDQRHLAIGLARCDAVTTDGSMKQLCREHGLIPDGVRVFSSRELDAMEPWLREQVAKKG